MESPKQLASPEPCFMIHDGEGNDPILIRPAPGAVIVRDGMIAMSAAVLAELSEKVAEVMECEN